MFFWKRKKGKEEEYIKKDEERVFGGGEESEIGKDAGELAQEGFGGEGNREEFVLPHEGDGGDGGADAFLGRGGTSEGNGEGERERERGYYQSGSVGGEETYGKGNAEGEETYGEGRERESYREEGRREAKSYGEGSIERGEPYGEGKEQEPYGEGKEQEPYGERKVEELYGEGSVEREGSHGEGREVEPYREEGGRQGKPYGEGSIEGGEAYGEGSVEGEGSYGEGREVEPYKEEGGREGKPYGEGSVEEGGSYGEGRGEGSFPGMASEENGERGEGKKKGFWKSRKEKKAEGGQEEKKGIFRRLVKGLAKTRNNIVSGIDAIFSSFSSIDEDFYEEIEEILIMGDLGVHATTEIIENLKAKVKELHIKDPAACKEHLISSIKEQMYVGETAYRFEDEKSVVLVIGVNGVGKTTTVGKLAGKMKDQGKRVVIAAADTFRAAAGEQLSEWANRAGVEMIGGQEGADPGAVVYDAVAAAKARNADVLLCDTAGRLHNKKNLMEELKKIHRILEKEYPDAFRETLVVLDGTTGQNALAQAKQFAEVADITGIVLTKMDGTAKGGIAVAIQSELGVPVKYIGVGETIDDLQKFDSEQFVNALFATEEEREAAGE